MATGATVTAAEIARLAGVGRTAVSNWRRRHRDFPHPRGGTAESPLFDLGEVEAWLAASGKRGVPVDMRLWHRLDAVRGRFNLAEVVGLVGGFLVYRDRFADTADAYVVPDAGSSAARHLSAALAEIDATLPGSDVAGQSLDADLLDLLGTVGDMAAERGAVATFDGMVERFLLAYKRQVVTTPPGLAELMVGLADRSLGVVFDPACGMSGLLTAAAAADPAARLVGQEINPDFARISAIRLALRGAAYDVRAGDSLHADAFGAAFADTVVCAPPFAERDWGHEELAYDPRWEYGTPPRAESELAWVQHALWHVRPGGVVVICLPPGVAFRGSGRRIRTELLRRGALRAVLALPSGAYPGTALPTQVWVLRRPDATAHPGRVLLMEAAPDHGPDRAESPDWAAITDRVRHAWSAVRDGHDVTGNPAAIAVPTMDLLTDEVDLTPARRTPLHAQPAATDFAHQTARFARTLDDLSRLLPRLAAATPAKALPTTTIGELVRLGALSVHRGAGITQADSDTSTDSDAVSVLTVRDVLLDQPASARAAGTVLDRAITLTRAGDIVVAVGEGALVTRILTEEGAMLGPLLALIRPHPDLCDPWFLAGFLRSPDNLRQVSTLGTGPRMDLRRALVPRLPMDNQRQYGELLRRIAEFRDTLNVAAEQGLNLAQAAIAGLANGGLHPLSHQ